MASKEKKEPLCVLMLTPVHMFNVLISIARGTHADVRRDRKFRSSGANASELPGIFNPWRPGPDPD